MRQELNIADGQADDKEFHGALAGKMREQILRGRELNGEPRDFNF